MKQLLEYNHIPFTLDLNFFDIPVTVVKNDDDGMEFWNNLLWNLQEAFEAGALKTLVRTKSGGISIAVQNWNSFPGFDVRRENSYAEITIVDLDGCWRFQFRRNFLEREISGRTAYLRFEAVCKQFGIDLQGMFLPDKETGWAVKQTIPKPMIDMRQDLFDIELDNVHHFDIHSAHMAGVAKAFPELEPPIRYCYENRKKWAIYKHILTHCWGYFQSNHSPVYYRLAHLSKAGLDYTNSEVQRITKELEDSGRLVIGHNTDGGWYRGEIYHGANEGKDLGQWSNDIVNATFRAKSAGVYEYIDENGIYHPVFRGRSELDKEKPRENWEWGDIYSAGDRIQYLCLEDGTLVKEKGEPS